MAFQLKNFVSIAAALINHMRGAQSELTDFNVGSVARTMLEAPAVEIDELYQQFFNGIMEAIPVATYRSFSFDTLAAVPASGVVTVHITAQPTDVLISAGTVFSVPGGAVSYISANDAIITVGNTTSTVLVAATAAGVAGNIAAGASFGLAPSPTGFVSATNVSAFINGLEEETDDQKQQRFIQYIASLQRATPTALAYGAKTAFLVDGNGIEIERVKAASVVEPYLTDGTQPVGLVNVYVHNGVGSTSGGLVTQATTVLTGYVDAAGNKIAGWKAAGIHMVVAAATEVPIDVTAVVTIETGFDPTATLAAVSAEISNYILGLDLGATFLFAEAVLLAMNIAGVVNIVFTTPTADHTSTTSQKLMPGTFTITAA